MSGERFICQMWKVRHGSWKMRVQSSGRCELCQLGDVSFVYKQITAFKLRMSWSF